MFEELLDMAVNQLMATVPHRATEFASAKVVVIRSYDAFVTISDSWKEHCRSTREATVNHDALAAVCIMFSLKLIWLSAAIRAPLAGEMNVDDKCRRQFLADATVFAREFGEMVEKRELTIETEAA